jgi:putative aldouronate transport system permease protein
LKPAAVLPASHMKNSKFRLLTKEIWKNRMVYTLVLPGLVWLFLFAYMPMGGLSLAFKDYKANLGIWNSPWVGFENFKYVFRDPAFVDAIWRTLAINIGKLIIQFPFPIYLSFAAERTAYEPLQESSAGRSLPFRTSCHGSSCPGLLSTFFPTMVW